MKSKKTVFYFPVDSAEQALLLRVRESPYSENVPALLEMIDLLAEARLDPAALEETPDRAYLHLAGVDGHGRPVVLVLEQHRWSRANGARHFRFGRAAQRTPHA